MLNKDSILYFSTSICTILSRYVFEKMWEALSQYYHSKLSTNERFSPSNEMGSITDKEGEGVT